MDQQDAQPFVGRSRRLQQRRPLHQSPRLLPASRCLESGKGHGRVCVWVCVWVGGWVCVHNPNPNPRRGTQHTLRNEGGNRGVAGSKHGDRRRLVMGARP